MNRDEITKLLEVLVTTYGKKVDNPKMLADAWEMVLGPYSAESVFKAARLHISTCKFFPKPSDIRENLIRADMIYDTKQGPAQLTSISGAKPIEDEKLNEWLDAFCEWIGFGQEPNDEALEEYYKSNPDMRAKMSGILPYEL